MLVGVFFQAEDGIRDLVRSRGLGDVYKRQTHLFLIALTAFPAMPSTQLFFCFRFRTPRSIALYLSLIHI